MPHWEHSVQEQRDHVRLCFDLAEEHDADVDMHVDETDDGSSRTLEMVLDQTVARNWQGRVTVGHVCALSADEHDYAERLAADCATAGVTVVANPVTNLMIQGRSDRGLIRRGTTRVREFLQAGVNLAFGQDCVADGFYPFGRGSMLEVALISAHATHLGTDDELMTALGAVTDAPARAWRLGDSFGIRPGARADLQIYAAGSWGEVLRLQQPPTHVFSRGRLVAQSEVHQKLVRHDSSAQPSHPLASV
jgi:cytosine deaminase